MIRFDPSIMPYATDQFGKVPTNDQLPEKWMDGVPEGAFSDDVFRHLNELNIPEESCILGSGPNLSTEFARAPQNIHTIAVNGSIQFSHIPDIWMVMDSPQEGCPWFYYEDISPKTKIIFYHWLTYRKRDYSFEIFPKIVQSLHLYQMLPGVLRQGGTIVFTAIQLLYWAGCKRIYMAGTPLGDCPEEDRYFYGRGKGLTENYIYASKVIQKVMKKYPEVELITLGPSALEPVAKRGY